jgi:SAM-dependent methyltransferase
MQLRRMLAQQMLRVSRALQYAVVAFLPPRQMRQWVQESYAHQQDQWCGDTIVAQGLNAFEEALLQTELTQPCDLLVLGCGGGRESLAFAVQGFHVTGIDNVCSMVERARVSATNRQLPATFIQQDIAELTLSNNAFDCAFFTLWLYEHLPTRALRVHVLNTLRKTLRQHGRIIFHVHLRQITPQERMLFPFLKLLAYLTWGNRGYQLGDRPIGSLGCAHPFATAAEVEAECAEAGLAHVCVRPVTGGWGAVVIAQATDPTAMDHMTDGPGHISELHTMGTLHSRNS